MFKSGGFCAANHTSRHVNGTCIVTRQQSFVQNGWRRSGTSPCPAYRSSGKAANELAASIVPNATTTPQRTESGQSASTSFPPTTQLTKRINAQLFAAQNIDKIQQVIAKQGAVFSAFNVAVCLKELARLYESQGLGGCQAVDRDKLQGMLRELCAIAEQHITEFGTWTISTCVWAFAKLGYKPEKLLGLFVQQTSEKMQQLKPLHVSKLLWGLARLQYQPGHAFLTAVADKVCGSLAEYEPQGLSNVVWAYAKLGRADEKLLKGVAEEALQKLPGFTAQGLSNLVWSFAVLKFHPGDLLHSLSTAIAQRLREYSCQGIANAVWAFSIFDHYTKDVLDEISLHPDAYLMYCTGADASNILVACARFDHREQLLLDFLLERALVVPEKLKPMEVSGLMWSLGKLEYFPPSLLPPMTSVVSRTAPHMSSQGMSNTLWAMGRLAAVPWAEDTMEQLYSLLQAGQHQFLPQHLSNMACAVARLPPNSAATPALIWIAQQAGAQVMEFHPEELSLLVWACGKAGVYSEELAEGACENFTHKWRKFNHHDVSIFLWGLGKMGFEPAPWPLFFSNLHCWLEEHSAQLTPRQVTMIAWALARMCGPECVPCMDQLLSTAQHQVDVFNSQDVAILSHSLGKMKCYKEDLMDAIADRAAVLCNDFKPDELVNTVWAFASFGHHPGKLLGVAANQVTQQQQDFVRWHLATLAWAFQQLGYRGDDEVSSGVRELAMEEGVWEQHVRMTWGQVEAEPIAERMYD